MAGRPLGKEQLRRIWHGSQAAAGHLEHAQLARRAEPVLHRAHDAVGVMPLTFEVQHGIHHVLKRLRPGQIAVLRDVAHEEDGHVVPLRREEELGGRLAHLPDAAGSGLELQREHRLDGVDDDERRLEARRFIQDLLQTGFREQVQGRAPTPSRSPRDLTWCSDSSPEL